MNDIFTEVYGFRKAKFIILLSFLSNLAMVILFFIAIKLPASSSFIYQKEFENILLMTPRVLIASFVAYIIGSLLNSVILSKMKEQTKGKYFAMRAIISSIIGEGIDTLIFIPIVFIGSVSFSVLIKMIFSVFILKVLIELLLVPITSKIAKKIKKIENIE